MQSVKYRINQAALTRERYIGAVPLSVSLPVSLFFVLDEPCEAHFPLLRQVRGSNGGKVKTCRGQDTAMSPIHTQFYSVVYTCKRGKGSFNMNTVNPT